MLAYQNQNIAYYLRNPPSIPMYSTIPKQNKLTGNNLIMQNLNSKNVYYLITDSSLVLISIILSLCFSLSHSARMWGQPLPNILNTLILTFVFSLYSFSLMFKMSNIWSAVVLHAYCNWLGGPVLDFKREINVHVFVTGIILFFSLFVFC